MRSEFSRSALSRYRVRNALSRSTKNRELVLLCRCDRKNVCRGHDCSRIVGSQRSFISQCTDFHFAKYRFSFRKVQTFISQSTDFHFAKYRFSFPKVQISFRKVQIFISQSTDFISQSTDFHFAKYRFHFAKYRFHFVSFRFAKYHFAKYNKPPEGYTVALINTGDCIYVFIFVIVTFVFRTPFAAL